MYGIYIFIVVQSAIKLAEKSNLYAPNGFKVNNSVRQINSVRQNGNIFPL